MQCLVLIFQGPIIWQYFEHFLNKQKKVFFLSFIRYADQPLFGVVEVGFVLEVMLQQRSVLIYFCYTVSTLWEQREGMLAGRKGLTFPPCCKLPESALGALDLSQLMCFFLTPLQRSLFPPQHSYFVVAMTICSITYSAIHRLYAEIKRQASFLSFNKLMPPLGKLHSLLLITCTSGLVGCSNPSLMQYHPHAHIQLTT